MKKLKRIILFILGFCLIFMTPILTSCFWDDDNNDSYVPSNDNNTTKISVEISNVEYGFINATDVTDDSQLSIKNTSKPTSFDVIKDYYFLISYTMTSRTSNDGTSLLNTNVSFDSTGFIDGNVYTTKSGENPTKTSIKDPGTGMDKINLSISNKIASEKDVSKEIKIVIKMKTLKYGEAYMGVSFSGSSLSLSGETDGFGKLLTINKVKLDAPELSFDDSSLELKFNNVKYADYYKTYVDGEILKDSAGNEVIYSVDEHTSVGAAISWDLSSYISGNHRVKIQSFSNSANFIVSDYSREVVVNI